MEPLFLRRITNSSPSLTPKVAGIVITNEFPCFLDFDTEINPSILAKDYDGFIFCRFYY